MRFEHHFCPWLYDDVIGSPVVLTQLRLETSPKYGDSLGDRDRVGEVENHVSREAEDPCHDCCSSEKRSVSQFYVTALSGTPKTVDIRIWTF